MRCILIATVVLLTHSIIVVKNNFYVSSLCLFTTLCLEYLFLCIASRLSLYNPLPWISLFMYRLAVSLQPFALNISFYVSSLDCLFTTLCLEYLFSCIVSLSLYYPLPWISLFLYRLTTVSLLPFALNISFYLSSLCLFTTLCLEYLFLCIVSLSLYNPLP